MNARFEVNHMFPLHAAKPDDEVCLRQVKITLVYDAYCRANVMSGMAPNFETALDCIQGFRPDEGVLGDPV